MSKFKVGDLVIVMTWEEIQNRYQFVADEVYLEGNYIAKDMFPEESSIKVISGVNEYVSTLYSLNGSSLWYNEDLLIQIENQSKVTYKIKTEEEFIEEFGDDWREELEFGWESPEMDPFFGLEITDEEFKDSLGEVLTLWLNDEPYSISSDMVSIELLFENSFNPSNPTFADKVSSNNTLFCSGTTDCYPKIECLQKHLCERYTENRYVMVDPKYNFMTYAPFDPERQVCKYHKRKSR